MTGGDDEAVPGGQNRRLVRFALKPCCSPQHEGKRKPVMMDLLRRLRIAIGSANDLDAPDSIGGLTNTGIVIFEPFSNPG